MLTLETDALAGAGHRFSTGRVSSPNKNSRPLVYNLGRARDAGLGYPA